MELALRLRTATHVMWQIARFRCQLRTACPPTP